MPCCFHGFTALLLADIKASNIEVDQGCCRPPYLGSDTHNSNKIDIKNYTFIIHEKSHYMVRVYIDQATGLISYIRVLRQRSYVIVAPFLQATWSADVTLDLFLKHTPISQSSQSQRSSFMQSHGPIFDYTPLFYPCVAPIVPSGYVLLQLYS